MNNDKLLIIAKGIGKDVKIETLTCTTNPDLNHQKIIVHETGYGYINFNPSENDTQFKDVTIWLTDIGYFVFLCNEGAGYFLNDDKNKRFCTGRLTTKENILEIAFQVANELNTLSSEE